MAPIKRSHSRSSSLELGEEDFGIKRNPKTGRPIRKSASRKSAGSGFIDWDNVPIASDEDDKEVTDRPGSDSVSSGADDLDLAPNIFKRAKKPRREPTPTPPVSPTLSSVPASTPELTPEPRELSETIPPITLSIHVEPGHQGPIQVQLDLHSLCTQISASQFGNHLQRHPNQLSILRSNSIDKTKVGFLSLAAELRNQVYRLLFVTEKPLDFSRLDNFRRSSQLLRICSQIYDEARPLLYSENKFIISRRHSSRGKPFVNGDSEIGYKDFLRFLRQIGQHNVGLIRDLAIAFEDMAANTIRRYDTAEERRFVYDDVLLSCLRNLARNGRLRKLSLSFQGKKELRMFDRHFMDIMKFLKADEVEFVHHPGLNIDPSNWASYRWASKQQDYVRCYLTEEITRENKLYD